MSGVYDSNGVSLEVGDIVIIPKYDEQKGYVVSTSTLIESFIKIGGLDFIVDNEGCDYIADSCFYAP